MGQLQEGHKARTAKLGVTALLLSLTTPLHAERILFLDEADIAAATNVERRLHAPQRAGHVFAMDAPWEGIESGYAAVMDLGDGTFRKIYRGGGESTPHEADVFAVRVVE